MQLLEKDVFFFTTFGGETLSLAAAQGHARASCATEQVPAALERAGTELRDELQ